MDKSAAQMDFCLQASQFFAILPENAESCPYSIFYHIQFLLTMNFFLNLHIKYDILLLFTQNLCTIYHIHQKTDKRSSI